MLEAAVDVDMGSPVPVIEPGVGAHHIDGEGKLGGDLAERAMTFAAILVGNMPKRQGRMILVALGQAGIRTAHAWVGDGLFLRPNEYHAYHDAKGDASLQVDWMNFDGAGVVLALASGPVVQSGGSDRPDLSER